MSYLPENLRVLGYNSSDQQVQLPAPLAFELVKSFDSPAQSFEAVFPCLRAYSELFRIDLYHGETKLFAGFIDEQTYTYDDRGGRLTILARSIGARLLDNEAAPRNYTNVYLLDMYNWHVKPYGLLLPNASINPFFNRYQVLKGTTEWEAFFNFLRSSQYGCAYVSDYGEIILSAHPPVRGTLTFSNRQKDALRFSSLKFTNDRYSPITKFLIRDSDGQYSYSYTNPEEKSLGLTRKRYLIPAEEFTPFSGGGEMEGMIRVRHSMLGKRVITLTCPGLLEARFCDRANVDAGLYQWSELFVYQVRHRMSAGGCSTVLTLLNSNYIL
ncbi:MAG: hypothetical protein HFG20_01670 [Anaerotruncus sp.]|nr:hypothetical protein [Anaerotruncus sp.]